MEGMTRVSQVREGGREGGRVKEGGREGGREGERVKEGEREGGREGGGAVCDHKCSTYHDILQS